MEKILIESRNYPVFSLSLSAAVYYFILAADFLIKFFYFFNKIFNTFRDIIKKYDIMNMIAMNQIIFDR